MANMEFVFGMAKFELWCDVEANAFNFRYVDNEGEIWWERLKSEGLDVERCEEIRRNNGRDSA